MNKAEFEEMASGAPHKLDTCGLLCPEPVMLLHKTVRAAAAGELIWVVATDPSTERDIPKFCQFLGHSLLATLASEDCYQYLISKTDA